MKRSTRILLLLLCVCMIIPVFASCADSNKKKDDSAKLDDYYDNSTRAKTKGNLPDDLYLGGEDFGIFYSSYMELDVEGEDETTDMVYTSIYERNLKVEAWLGVNLNFYPSDATKWDEVSGEITNLVLTNDGSTDAIIGSSNSIIQNKLYSLFLDLSYTDYLDLDEPWWNMKAINETSLDGKVYEFLFGDILLSSITACGAIFYNKDLYERFYPEKGRDYIYTMVEDKTWTLDQFHYICNNTYLDQDGDQVRSDGDIYAYQLFRYAEPIHYFANSAGIEYYKREKTGYPKITINSAKSIEFTEKLEKLLYENKGANLYYPNQIGKEEEHPHDFEDGRILFKLSTLGAALDEEMRQMNSDYGIVPYPLWDEYQEEYITLIANGAALVCVPYTADGADDRLNKVISPVLEAMAIEGYRSVTENFYELALKSSYTRDDIASEMIDLIVATSTKNFLYEYSSSLSDIGTIFSTVMSSQGKKEFASTYASIEGAANEFLRQLILEYAKNFGI